MDRRLRRSDLPVDTVALARFLIGKILVHDLRGQRTSGRVVEVEAYPVEYISSGPVMENVVTGDDVNLTIFPTPTWHELDGGPGTVNIFRNAEATWKERAEGKEEHDGEYSIPDSKQRTYF